MENALLLVSAEAERRIPGGLLGFAAGFQPGNNESKSVD